MSQIGVKVLIWSDKINKSPDFGRALVKIKKENGKKD